MTTATNTLSPAEQMLAELEGMSNGGMKTHTGYPGLQNALSEARRKQAVVTKLVVRQEKLMQDAHDAGTEPRDISAIIGHARNELAEATDAYKSQCRDLMQTPVSVGGTDGNGIRRKLGVRPEFHSKRESNGASGPATRTISLKVPYATWAAIVGDKKGKDAQALAAAFVRDLISRSGSALDFAEPVEEPSGDESE